MLVKSPLAVLGELKPVNILRVHTRAMVELTGYKLLRSELGMRNDWILDVLTDLKAFAVANEMAALAKHLDDTTLIAAADIASHGNKASASAHVNDHHAQLYSRGAGGQHLA